MAFQTMLAGMKFSITGHQTLMRFGGDIYHDNIEEEFDGQGHRSKVKIDMFKNMIF